MATALAEELRTWGDNIRAHRKLRGPDGQPRRSGADATMSQAHLGELVDPPVAQSTVQRWEKGLIEPRRHYKVQLARILGVDVAQLFPLTRGAA
jgi:DNA-binding XRE family transcriptional regulator